MQNVCHVNGKPLFLNHGFGQGQYSAVFHKRDADQICCSHIRSLRGYALISSLTLMNLNRLPLSLSLCVWSLFRDNLGKMQAHACLPAHSPQQHIGWDDVFPHRLCYVNFPPQALDWCGPESVPKQKEKLWQRHRAASPTPRHRWKPTRASSRSIAAGTAQIQHGAWRETAFHPHDSIQRRFRSHLAARFR